VARELSEVGVVGLGTMGAGIAEVFARAGLSVTAVDVDDAAVQRGRGHVEKSTGRAVSRGRLDPADRDAIVSRIRFTTSMDDLAQAELVVEAVPERVDLKAAVLSALDRICPPDTILATNTSAMPAPIVPSPTTPTSLSSLATRRVSHRAGGAGPSA
jgi:3-hydroxybutyryl-CoA dehydrogenase